MTPNTKPEGVTDMVEAVATAIAKTFDHDLAECTRTGHLWRKAASAAIEALRWTPANNVFAGLTGIPDISTSDWNQIIDVALNPKDAAP